MDGIHTMATIDSIDGETINVTHPPIPDLKWPAMTMDLMPLDGAKVGDVEAGDEANADAGEGRGWHGRHPRHDAREVTAGGSENFRSSPVRH